MTDSSVTEGSLLNMTVTQTHTTSLPITTSLLDDRSQSPVNLTNGTSISDSTLTTASTMSQSTAVTTMAGQQHLCLFSFFITTLQNS